jgi:iron complex outermembrane receptor protein
MRARLISFALMVFIVLPPLRASGQGPQDLKRLSIEQLMQIDVTLATRTPEPLATAPTAISIVTGDDIRRAGVSTLADAVALAAACTSRASTTAHGRCSARLRRSRCKQDARHD